jgi:hypothetical protein
MIKLGDVFRIRMDTDDGIVPKGMDSYRYKYIVIIGYDGKNCHAALVTNTNDHYLVPIKFQYPLCHNGYKCFVNCFRLFDVSTNRLTQNCYKGKISDVDFDLIIGCVKESPRIIPSDLKRYGII